MSYARVIYPYQTGVTGDLHLQVDDIIEILVDVDENWLRGRHADKTGLVPRQFIEYLPAVLLNDNQSLYIAHTDYCSSHDDDLQFSRGDLLIVDQYLSNGWMSGVRYKEFMTSRSPTKGIFPNTFVNFVKGKQRTDPIPTTTSTTSSHSNVEFVRAICDVQPKTMNDLGCFEDEILAVIEGDVKNSDYLIVKNSFGRIGRIACIHLEAIDDKQTDDERSELLSVPKIDPIQALLDNEWQKFMSNPTDSQTPFVPPSTNITYPLTSSYSNSNNNNNNHQQTLDVHALYTSYPLTQFSTQNHYHFTPSIQEIHPVCQTPSSNSSISSFDQFPAPPVKPRLSVRPQLPPPPPPPPVLSSNIPPIRGPTRPAPRPPIPIKIEEQKITFRKENNPFDNDDTNSNRDSCDIETSSTRTDFFDLELQNLHNQLAIANHPVDRIDDINVDFNRNQRRRQHVISELVSTERDYLHDLDLLIETFLHSKSLVCPDHVNKALLFGNLEQIADVSRRFLRQLEFQSAQTDDRQCCIGSLVNSLVEEMKHSYAEYCRNHEWVHSYLRKHSQDEKLQQYLQDGLCKLRLQKSTVFDVQSLLLRPIQRIVRYPLILNELFKNTEVDHPDYLPLKDAISNFISMANFINEYKRRKEIVSKYQRRDKDEALTNKLYRLNLHTMRKKSARISMRLSSAFGLSSHTVDEKFNFEEQRFRAMEKFLRLFVRNAHVCMEALKENFVTQVNVAEDFRELLAEKNVDLAEKFVRSKRNLLENAFTEFCTHMESCVANPINTLVKLFVLPSNLISKRHDKLLDFDSAQSAYDKTKDQQSRQAKQVLDLAKKTYEALNSQLLEELPILYTESCQIISMCFKSFLVGYLRLAQQWKTNIRSTLTTIEITAGQLTWLQIVDRFTNKTSTVAEQIFQLTITAKNFSDKLKHLSPTKLSTLMQQIDQGEKYLQTQDIRRLIRNRYAEKDLFTVIRDFPQGLDHRTTDINVRSGDLVALLKPEDHRDPNCFVDNGITRGFLPRSILIPLSSGDHSGYRSHTPPTPLRHDLRPSLPIYSHQRGFANSITTSRPTLMRANTEPQTHLINSAFSLEIEEKENERIYLNQIDTSDSHQYASIDIDESERIFIALYDFEGHTEGVLPLHIGEQLRVLRRLDDAGNNDWWYVEKVLDRKQRGYVPANYIKALE